MEHNLDYKTPPSYSEYKRRANEHFPGDAVISKEEFNDLSARECHYCGKKGPNGIDRVDNNKGYLKENCVPCCKHCNYAKGNLSMEDFSDWKQRFVDKNK
jgi:5-methylcytosine-specific restriction endonuclease McrA